MQVCAQYNITAIAFLSTFGKGAPLMPNLANHNVSTIEAAITACQSYGAKILLSLGGQGGMLPSHVILNEKQWQLLKANTTQGLIYAHMPPADCPCSGWLRFSTNAALPCSLYVLTAYLLNKADPLALLQVTHVDMASAVVRMQPRQLCTYGSCF